MSESEWYSHWQEFQSELRCEIPAAPDRTTPDTTHLDRVESLLNFKLPLSYRAFIRVFGPVDLNKGKFRIYAPASRMKGGGGPDLVAHNKYLEQAISEKTDPESAELLSRAVVFANDPTGRADFFWDRGTITAADEFEYRIHYLVDPLEPSPIPICDDFSSFVKDYCLGGGFWKLMGWSKSARKATSYSPLGFGPTSRQ